MDQTLSDYLSGLGFNTSNATDPTTGQSTGTSSLVSTLGNLASQAAPLVSAITGNSTTGTVKAANNITGATTGVANPPASNNNMLYIVGGAVVAIVAALFFFSRK